MRSEDRRAGPGEIAVLKTSAAFGGRFLPDKNKVVVADDVQRVTCPVCAGTVILSRMNTKDLVGESGYVDRDHPNLFLPDRLWALHAAPETDARWMAHMLASSRLRDELGQRATGTSGSMKNISQESLLSIPIFLPTLPEQRRIAAVLDAWDTAISQAERLHDSLDKRQRGISVRLVGIHSGRRVTLGSIGRFEKGRGLPKTVLTEVGIPCLRYAEIYTRYGDTTSAFAN